MICSPMLIGENGYLAMWIGAHTMMLFFCIMFPLSLCHRKIREYFFSVTVLLRNEDGLHRCFCFIWAVCTFFSVLSTCSPYSPSLELEPDWLWSQATTNEFFPLNLPHYLCFTNVTEGEVIELKLAGLLVEVSFALTVWWKPL